jgi:hypothetical protein
LSSACMLVSKLTSFVPPFIPLANLHTRAIHFLLTIQINLHSLKINLVDNNFCSLVVLTPSSIREYTIVVSKTAVTPYPSPLRNSNVELTTGPDSLFQVDAHLNPQKQTLRFNAKTGSSSPSIVETTLAHCVNHKNFELPIRSLNHRGSMKHSTFSINICRAFSIIQV